ncbi:unnamed protein product [Trypanosoma congolense IL3000]|uniref:WGS project CAEQ00000000 data, annotated contig 825 n=1 Tax=Trypanosoma congolense (strain IL3000) TaxID=1068625 RepID=F9WIS3_TRYCI|nr:unnamed protein product [Trypanosoma congolense IL3000]
MGDKDDTSNGQNSEKVIEGRRRLTWEEYRAIYVEEQRRRFLAQRGGANISGGAVRGGVTPGVYSSAPPQSQQPPHIAQAHQPEREQRFYGAAGNVQSNVRDAFFAVWNFLFSEEMLIRGIQIVGRAVLASVLVFHSFDFYYIMVILGVYTVWCVVKASFSSVWIKRVGTGTVRSPEGVAPADGYGSGGLKGAVPARPQNVTPVRKVLYIVGRCFSSFVLSVSPTYSVERLEAELAADGIVAPHPHIE